jgi:hypothetical protein
MKGIVFCAFVSFAETRWSEELADQMLTQSDLETGGAYTSVGQYSHDELTQLSKYLAKYTSSTPDQVMNEFGQFLFPLLAEQADAVMKTYTSCFDFLCEIETVIHRDVRRLDTTAQVPMITALSREGDSRIVLEYRSARPFAMMAQGLFLGALSYFRMDRVANLKALEVSSDNTHAIFEILT